MTAKILTGADVYRISREAPITLDVFEDRQSEEKIHTLFEEGIHIKGKNSYLCNILKSRERSHRIHFVRGSSHIIAIVPIG